MRVWLPLIALLAMGLAGCAEESAPKADSDEFEDIDFEVDDTHGVILGVVVDQAIVPVPEATVDLMVQGELKTKKTDEQGRFVFSKVPAGSYFLKVQKMFYEPAQASVVVEAGVEKPPTVKVQITKLFEGDPFIQNFQFKGFFTCAYNFFVSSTCVNDYTRINPTGHCPGGCFPELASAVDNREYDVLLEPNWATIQTEMIWDESLAGTSDTMGMTISYRGRPTATHYWFTGSGESPMIARLDIGIPHPSQNTPSGSIQAIPPEGLEDLFVFMAAGETQVSVQQDFEIFHIHSFYANLPEDWSFVRGDGEPF